MNKNEKSNRYEAFGARLKFLREQWQQSLQDVSNTLEIDQKTLKAFESGTVLPAPEILDMLISHFLLTEDQANDQVEKKMVVIPNTDCNFSYRNSRFKTEDRGRFFITSVTLSLTKNQPMPPFYASVEKYLKEHDIKRPTSAQNSTSSD